LDTRSKMGLLGDLNRYAQYQSATAIDDAARNPGGAAGTGVGIGAGIALGQQFAGNATVTPPPIPASFFVAVKDAQTGPFDINTLAAKTRDGSLTRETLVWRQGMREWSAAGTVAELQ